MKWSCTSICIWHSFQSRKFFHCEQSGNEMFQKKYFLICAAIVYVVLIVLFTKSQKNRFYDRTCYYEKPCVRFCCKDEKLCNQKFIDEHFDASTLPDEEDMEWNAAKGVKAYIGKPICSLKQSEKSWELLRVKSSGYFNFQILIFLIFSGWLRQSRQQYLLRQTQLLFTRFVGRW